HLARFLAHRHPNALHAALVISQGGLRARKLGTDEEIRICSIGATRKVLSSSPGSTPQSDVFDRQVRAFGETGQRALQALTVGVAGLGGTGSIVCQLLAHLGVREVILV